MYASGRTKKKARKLTTEVAGVVVKVKGSEHLWLYHETGQARVSLGEGEFER